MKILIHIPVTLFVVALFSSAQAEDRFTVSPVSIKDEKAVFATVESANIVPARARIGGTIAELSVVDGDHVDQGESVGTVGDEKIALQISALDSRIAVAEAEASRAETELNRQKTLVSQGVVSVSALDRAKRDYDVAANTRKAAVSERDVLRKQLEEGNVLAPVAGRVLTVPVTAGTVVMPGEALATIAEENYILRLEVPERHARFMKSGDAVRLDQPELSGKASGSGKVTLVYPQIDNGRVVADAAVEGLDNYFVGQRVRVWISSGERSGFVVPPDYLVTRFGVDYARVVSDKDNASAIDVPVQRGQDTESGVEILSGLHDGDVLVKP